MGVLWKISTYDFSQTFNFYVERALGAGYPDPTNVVTRYGLADGGLFNRQVYPPRNFALVGKLLADSPGQYHGFRQLLIGQIKRDRTRPIQPFILSYEVDGAVLEIEAYFAGGLSGDGALVGFNESLTLRFQAVDPLWQETADETAGLTASTTATVNRVIRTTGDGQWEVLGAGADDTVWSIAENEAYIALGGAFDEFDGETVNHVVLWNKATSTAIPMGGATIGTNGTVVYRLAFNSAGLLYGVGDFTTAGGVTVNRIFVYDPETDTFDDLDGGANGILAGLAIDADDNVFVGGIASNFGTSLTGFGAIGKWSEGAWSKLGTGADVGVWDGETALVWSLVVIGPTLYVGGTFDKIAGQSITCANIGQYSIAGNTWAAMGTGVEAQQVRDMAAGLYGLVYVAMVGPSVTSPLQIWNGSEFEDGGLTVVDGNPEGLYSMAYDTVEQRLWAGGPNFSPDGGATESHLLYYDGANWNEPELDVGGLIATDDEYPTRIAAYDGSVIIAVPGAGSLLLPALTTVTSPGTTESFPIFTITGPGTVASIRNLTTGDKIAFIDGGIVLATGETLTISLVIGARRIYSTLVSNYRFKLSDDSHLARFSLFPGENILSVSIEDTTTLRSLAYRPKHWSFDAVAVI